MQALDAWLKHFNSADETPFGPPLTRMIVILGVGMLVVAILGMLTSRRNRGSIHRWWDHDGLTYDHSTFSSGEASWFDSDSSSWSGSDDVGSD